MSGFDFNPQEIVGECVPSDDFLPYLDCLVYQSDLPLKTSTDFIFGFIFRDDKPLLITRKKSDKSGFELQDFFKHQKCERINSLDLDSFPEIPKEEPSLLFLNFFVNDKGLLGRFFDIRNFSLQIVYHDPNPGWEYCKNIPFSDGLDVDQKLLQTLNEIGFCNNSQKDREYVRSRVSSKDLIATYMGKVKGPGAGQSENELEYSVFEPKETIQKIMRYLIDVEKVFYQIDKTKKYSSAENFKTFLIWYPEIKSIAYVENGVVYEKNIVDNEKRAYLELGKHKYGFNSLSKDFQAYYSKKSDSNVYKMWMFIELHCNTHKDIFQAPKIDLPKPSDKPKEEPIPSQTQPSTNPVYTQPDPIKPTVVPPQETGQPKSSTSTGGYMPPYIVYEPDQPSNPNPLVPPQPEKVQPEPKKPFSFPPIFTPPKPKEPFTIQPEKVQPTPENPFSFPSFPPPPKKSSTTKPEDIEPSPKKPFSFPSPFPSQKPKEPSTFKPDPSTPPRSPQVLPPRPLKIYDVIETRQQIRLPTIPKISQNEKEEFYERYREKQFYFETYADYEKIKLNLNYSNIFLDLPQGTYFVKGQTSEDFETEIVKHVFPDYKDFNNPATNQEISFGMTLMKRDSGYKLLHEYLPERRMNKHMKHDFMVYDYKLSKVEAMQKNFLSLRSAYSTIEIEASMIRQGVRGSIALKIAFEPATLPQAENDLFVLGPIKGIPTESSLYEYRGILAYHLQRNGRSFMENKTNALSGNLVELYDYSLIGVLFFLLRK
jgi:hypothetical protein